MKVEDLENLFGAFELYADLKVNKELKLPDTLDEALKRDSLAEISPFLEDAENETQRTALMLGHAGNMNKRKNELLKSAGDTIFSDSLERYQSITADIGFEKVLELDFYSTSSNKDEKFFIFWRTKGGVLLAYDTYFNKVNGGKFYFNWRSHSGESPEGASYYMDIKDQTGKVKWDELHPNYVELTTDPEVLEKHRLWQEKWKRESVCVCGVDCREAIRFKINKLESTGDFVTPWQFTPFIWLLHHMDKTENSNYKQINKERIAMLPDFVRSAITCEES